MVFRSIRTPASLKPSRAKKNHLHFFKKSQAVVQHQLLNWYMMTIIIFFFLCFYCVSGNSLRFCHDDVAQEFGFMGMNETLKARPPASLKLHNSALTCLSLAVH